MRRAVLAQLRVDARGRGGSGTTRELGPLAILRGVPPAEIAALLEALPVDEVGKVAVTRCYGLAGPPQGEDEVRISLPGRTISRRTLQQRKTDAIVALVPVLALLAATSTAHD